MQPRALWAPPSAFDLPRTLLVWLVCLWLGLGGGLPVCSAVPAQELQEERQEYAVKAQILIKLIPYVHWPEDTESRSRPLVLAVVGRSPFEGHLDRLAKLSPTIHGRPLKVIYAPRYSDDLICDLMFICPSLAREGKAILAKTRGRAILTMGDDERLSNLGVMVNLLLQENNKTRLVVNRTAALEEKLTLSSQLLRVAKIIEAPEKP
jgi:hypothetical protein